jgi:hypothetical protein
VASKKGGKYATLKGQIPDEVTPRAAAVEAAMRARAGRSLAELTREYNEVQAEKAVLAEQMKALGYKDAALDLLIRKALEAEEADSISMNGFTWSENVEPYPVVLLADVAEIEKYFRENGLESELNLSASEMATRLKRFIKEEAIANELTVVEVEQPDGSKKTEVRSKIPGVTVYLHKKLSRNKISKGVS